MRYEDLSYRDEILPIIFRKDTRLKSAPPMLMHWHEAVELLWIQEGEVLVQSNTETVTASKGQVVCIHSNHLHSYASVGDKCTYYCVILAPEVVGCQQLYESALPLISEGGSARLFAQCVAVLEQQDLFYKQLAKSLLTELYICLAKEQGDQAPGSDRRMTAAVKEALGYIEVHFAEPLNIEQIARAVGVSRYHLCHIFKEITGKTLAQYWQNVRCAKARKLLKNGASVAEAADRTGFSSAEYFTKVYQKHFSVLPSSDKI